MASKYLLPPADPFCRILNLASSQEAQLSRSDLFLLCALSSLWGAFSSSPEGNNMTNEDGKEDDSGLCTDIGKAGGINIDMTSCCASCGIAEVDDIKLTACDADCKLVRYCSVACQRDHRSQHKEECKKRVAELRDDLLFAQPESSHLGDCPICFLPLPLDASKRAFMTCCSKEICDGCWYANMIRELSESLKRKCPFCRHPLPTTKAESDANIMKRVEANDPVAMREMGMRQHSEGDCGSAFGFLRKAAGLGDAVAHFPLSIMHSKGKGVDLKKQIYHLEEAAIGGHPSARFYLGDIEWSNGSKEGATKHFIIAANQGDDESVKRLNQCYLEGVLSKEDFAAALRAYQAAVDAMKSPQRDAAEKSRAGGH